MNLKLIAKITLALLPLIIAGCGSDSDKHASVRIVHNSPDAPAVDVAVDGGNVLSGVSYRQFSDFLDVESGERRFQVFVAGTNLAVIDVTPNLESGESYTVLANNRVLNIAPLLLKSRREPLESGQVTVRAVHGAPSAPAVDIYVTAPNVSLSDATPVLTNVPFGAASDYLSIPAGDYQVRITVAGTKTVAIDSGALSLTANQVITLVAQDNVGSGAPFSLLALPE